MAPSGDPTASPTRTALGGGSYSQTLSRGVRLLEAIAAAGRPLSATEMSEELQLHRSIIYRLARTLEGHRLLASEPGGGYTLGLGLLTLARSVEQGLRSAVRPILADLSAAVDETAILGLVDGEDIVCIASVEPPDGVLRVRYREGYRHRIEFGAGGLAVQSTLPPAPDERPAIKDARKRGYAVTIDELKEGAAAVSAPVLIPGQPTRMSVTVVMPTGHLSDPEAIGQAVIASAKAVASLF